MEGTPVIRLHRLSREGETFALNPDLFERVEVTPDTTITLVDGSKYNVKESLDEVMVLIQEYRAKVIRMSHQMEDGTYVNVADRPGPTAESGTSGGNVIQLPRKGR